MSYESIKTQQWTATITLTFTLDADTWNGEDVPQQMIANAIETACISSSFDEVASSALYEDAGYVEVEDDDGEMGEYDRIENCHIGTTSASATVRRTDADVTVAAPPPPTSEGVPLNTAENYWATRPVRA